MPQFLKRQSFQIVVRLWFRSPRSTLLAESRRCRETAWPPTGLEAPLPPVSMGARMEPRPRASSAAGPGHSAGSSARCSFPPAGPGSRQRVTHRLGWGPSFFQSPGAAGSRVHRPVPPHPRSAPAAREEAEHTEGSRLSVPSQMDPQPRPHALPCPSDGGLPSWLSSRSNCAL